MDVSTHEKNIFDVGGGYKGKEASMASRTGYSIPIAESFGLAFEFNFNYTYRLKPMSVLPGRYYHEQFFLIGVTYSPSLFTRYGEN